MKFNRFPWWLIALVLGFGLGLVFAWSVIPTRSMDAEPDALRADFKDQYRSAIAAAYASTGDLERARARLALLGDPDPAQALTAQAQRMLGGGETFTFIQYVAMLAAALQGQATASPPAAVTTSNISPVPTSASLSREITSTPQATLPSTKPEMTNTVEVETTPTPRPTHTAVPTLTVPFLLIGQDSICDTELAEGLLQIIVTDAERRQIPGAEIIVTWNGGEEHIFTGIKPELGHGYADYQMTPGVTYSLRMADGGTSATGLSAPACTTTDGNSYNGGIRVTFQQP